MPTATVLDTLAGLRPQGYGTGSPGRVADPVVEPLWSGVRVLAAVTPDAARLQDADGRAVEERPAIADALRAGLLAESAILDGWLTKEAALEGDPPPPGTAPVELPSMGRLIGQSIVGTRRDRAREATERLEQVRRATTFGPDEFVAFVATDLLWLDGDPLLDVPLLERKRLLDTTLRASDLVRVGAFVRPPIDTWVGSWRALGFMGLSFRAANSRYHPGERRPEWATAPMPRR